MRNQAERVKQKAEVFAVCMQKGHLLLQKGTAWREEKAAADKAAEAFTVEYAKNARYLHRGYYCPSLARDALIGNSRRGSLVKKPIKMENITHKYFFSPDGKLRKAISFIPADNNMKTEYLLHENNIVYGLAYDASNNLVGLSEEMFDNGKVVSYFCASCFVQPIPGMNFGITEMFYETYHYVEQKLHSMMLFHVCPYIDNPNDEEEIDMLIDVDTYEFVSESGCIVGFKKQCSRDEDPFIYYYPNIKGKRLASPNLL